MGRYDRQVLDFGSEGQDAVRAATVGIVGCGGLGNSVALALAEAGVGRLIVADPDSPDETNLNRQFMYSEKVGSGRPKAELMADWIRSLNPDVEAEPHAGRFTGAEGWFDACDIIVDCLDSMSPRMDVNDYCVRTGKPLVHGAIDGFTGQLAVVIPGRTPCLRCMIGGVPDREGTPASIGSVVMSVGAMQATEVLKIILGRSDRSEGLFVSFDFLTDRHTAIRFDRDPDCRSCGRPSRLSLRTDINPYGVSETMQPKMRDHQMSGEEIGRLLARSKEGVLSTNGEDGCPYGTPVNYVFLDGTVFIHGRPMGEKMDNIVRDPRCCFTVMEAGGFEVTGDKACNTTTVYESVIIRGRAEIVTDDADKARVLRVLVDALVPERKDVPMDLSRVPPTAVFRIIPDSVTGKYHRPVPGHPMIRGSLQTLQGRPFDDHPDPEDGVHRQI